MPNSSSTAVSVDCSTGCLFDLDVDETVRCSFLLFAHSFCSYPSILWLLIYSGARRSRGRACARGDAARDDGGRAGARRDGVPVERLQGRRPRGDRSRQGARRLLGAVAPEWIGHGRAAGAGAGAGSDAVGAPDVSKLGESDAVALPPRERAAEVVPRPPRRLRLEQRVERCCERRALREIFRERRVQLFATEPERELHRGQHCAAGD